MHLAISYVSIIFTYISGTCSNGFWPLLYIYRYIVICFPLKSKVFNSRKNIRTAIIVVWISALFLAIPVIKDSSVSFVKDYRNG